MNIIKSSEGRIWEIDFLRGVAVMMMIAFHLLYDLNYFAGFSFVLHAGFWFLFARLTAMIFVFLTGVSLALSHARVAGKLTPKEMTKKYVGRGFKIFGWGIIITILTLFLLESGTIWFGVLHLIGISIIIARPLLRFRHLNLVLGIAFIIIGLYLNAMSFDFPWLTPLGLRPVALYTMDYLPLFPWLGVVLLGLFFGNTVCKCSKAERIGKGGLIHKTARPLCFAGRHSLLIYLLHQPVLIGLIYLLLI